MKLSIALALAHHPKLLILDEPTGGLDPLMQNKFFELLRQENRRGTTIFFSSHILGEVQRLCDRVAIIKEGRLLKVEHIDTLRSNKYKKIKLEFSLENEWDTFELEGIKEFNLKHNGAEFMFSGNMNALIDRLNDYRIENLWIEEPSLEEIFMHYYAKEEKE